MSDNDIAKRDDIDLVECSLVLSSKLTDISNEIINFLEDIYKEEWLVDLVNDDSFVYSHEEDAFVYERDRESLISIRKRYLGYQMMISDLKIAVAHKNNRLSDYIARMSTKIIPLEIKLISLNNSSFPEERSYAKIIKSIIELYKKPPAIEMMKDFLSYIEKLDNKVDKAIRFLNQIINENFK